MNNAYMMTLQAEYLANRSSESLYQELFASVWEMAAIQVNSICKHRNIHFTKEKTQTIAADVAIQLMARYANKDWFIRKSFIQAIHLECLQLMFDKRHRDKIKYVPLADGISDRKAIQSQELIASLIADSCYFDIILDAAKKNHRYTAYLLRVAKYHSLDWIDCHVANLNALWHTGGH